MIEATTHTFPYSPNLTAADNENHEPGPERNWQESSYFFYCDTESGAAGLQRMGIHPNQGAANLYSWTMVDGRMVYRRKHTGLPLPQESTTRSTLEGVSITTLKPCEQFRIRTDQNGIRTDIEWTSLPGPVSFPLDARGKVVGSNHYNALGRAVGTIEHEGRVHTINGFGYMDHSWGPRDMSTVFGHSSIQAIFRDDYYIETIVSWGPQGKVMKGYLFKDGEFSFIREIVATYTVDDDTFSPLGSEVTATDELGRVVTMTATTVGETSLQPYGQGYFATQGMCSVTSGADSGMGFIEFSSPKRIPLPELDALGMSADNAWLQQPSVGA